MPISFKCSECDTMLRAADTFAGKKCKCTKCATVNVIPAPEVEEEEAIVEASPKQKKSANGIAAGTPKAKKPAAIVAKTLGNAKQTAAVVDDEADTPTEADEIAEDDDEPAPKKRTGKSKEANNGGRSILLIGSIVGMLLLVLAGGAVGGGIWWYRSSNASASTTDKDKNDDKNKPSSGLFWEQEHARYFPDNPTAIIVARFADMWSSPYYQDAKTEVGDAVIQKLEDDMGSHDFYLAIPDIDYFTIVLFDMPNGIRDGKVIRTKKPLQAADVVARFKKRDVRQDPQVVERQVGGKTVYEFWPNGGQRDPNWVTTICVDGPYVIVTSASMMKTILERGKAPVYSERMKAALMAADFSKAIAIAFVQPDDVNRRCPGIGFFGASLMPFGLQGKVEVKPDWVANSLELGSDLRFNATLMFKDAKAAADALPNLKANAETFRNEGMAKGPPAIRESTELFDFKSRVDGNSVIAEQTVSKATFLKVFREIAKKNG